MNGWYSHKEKFWRGVIIAVFIGLVGLIVSQARDEADRQAVIRHRCKLVRHEAGQAVVVATGRGLGVGSTSNRDCYRCLDGVEECF